MQGQEQVKGVTRAVQYKELPVKVITIVITIMIMTITITVTRVIVIVFDCVITVKFRKINRTLALYFSKAVFKGLIFGEVIFGGA